MKIQESLRVSLSIVQWLLAWMVLSSEVAANAQRTNAVTGAISIPGEMDRYSFSVSERSLRYFDALAGPQSIHWSLADSAGSVLVSTRSFTGSDGLSVSSPVLNLEPGNYLLTIAANSASTNNYAFNLLDLGDAALLAPGAPITNTLSPANETDIYRFTANAGDQFEFDRISLDSSLNNTFWRLIDPFGNEVFARSFSDGEATLRNSGAYTLLIEGYIFNTNSGVYAFNVIPRGNIPPIPFSGTPITIGSVVSGNIAAPATNLYRFTLNAQTRILFDTLTNSPSTYWTLEGPPGILEAQQLLSSSDGLNGSRLLTLPEGEYQLRLFRTQAGSTAFSFRLLDADGGSAITLGTPVNGTLEPVSSTRLYRFDLAAPTRIYFDANTTNGPGSAYVRLFDARNEILYQGYLSSDRASLELPRTGRYVLSIEGYILETDTVNGFSFNLVPINDGTQALQIGALTGGAVSHPGQAQHYAFTLNTETMLYFDSRTNLNQFRWTLEGAQGVVVNQRSFVSSDSYSTSDPIQVLPPGNYTLTVEAVRDEIGEFQFQLVDINSATTIQPGLEVSGTLNPPNATVFYRFTAPVEGKIYLDVGSHTGAPNCYFRFLNRYGDVLASGFLGDFGPLQLRPGELHYLLLEGAHSDVDVGLYTFTIVPVQDSVAPIALNALTTGEISSPGKRNIFTFSLAAESVLYFDAQTNLNFLRWSLDGPRGTVVNQRSFSNSDGASNQDPLMRLPPGNYRLTVDGTTDNTGQYVFRLLDLGAAPILTPGTAVSGSLSPGSETDIYRFTAASGDRFSFNRSAQNGAPNAYWRLFDPFDNRIFSMFLNSDPGTNRLPVSGTYYLLIEGYFNDAEVGTYAFNVIPVDNVPSPPFTGSPLTLGATVTGSLPSPDSTNSYLFNLATPARLFFDTLVNVDFRWSLVGPPGAIVQNRSFQNSDSVDVIESMLMLPAGAYRLDVYGETNSYSFRLLDSSVSTEIVLGASTTGSLAPGLSSTFFHFNATAGDRYFYEGRPSTGFSAGPYVRIYAPLGNRIDQLAVAQDVGPFEVLQTGRYLVAVEGRYFESGTNGTFNFTLSQVIDGTNSLSIGARVDGAITTPGQQQVYRFDLPQRSRIFFDSLVNVSFRWSLSGPRGEIVSDRSFQNADSIDSSDASLDLPAGQYTLSVRAFGPETGDYAFRLLDAAGAVPVQFGVVTTGILTPGNSTALYRFSGNEGDRIYLDGRPTAGFSQQPYVRLYSPKGRILFSQSSTADEESFFLPETGTYLFSVEGRYFDTGGSGTFSFALIASPLSPAIPLFESNEAPDLIVESVSVSPAGAFQTGQFGTVQWAVRNAGNVATDTPFLDRFTIRNSATGSLVTSGTLPYPGPGIVPGQSVPRQLSFVLPHGHGSVGELEVAVITDSNNNIPEQNVANTGEANNARAISISVSLAPSPDLVVTNISAPATALPGAMVPVVWTLFNRGAATTSLVDWSDYLFLSSDDTVGDDEFIGSVFFSGTLAPNSSITRTQVVTIPNFGTGPRYWIVQADGSDQVVEEDESNNLGIGLQAMTIPTTLTLALSRNLVSENAGTNALVATLSRNGATGSAQAVSLSTDQPSTISIPASIIFAVGASSTSFPVGVIDNNIVAPDFTAAIIASAPGYNSSTNRFTIREDDTAAFTLRFTPSTIAENAATPIMAVLTRNAFLDTAQSVTLGADRPSLVTLPPTVAFPVGSTNLTFEIRPVNNSAVAGNRPVVIFVSASGFPSISGQLTVMEDDTVSLQLQLAQSTVLEGQINPATIVTLVRVPTTDSSQRVRLRSRDSSPLRFPAEVTIPAGQPAGSFDLNLLDDNAVTGDRTEMLTAEALALDGSPIAGSAAAANLSIVEDDGPTLELTINPEVIAEDGSAMAIVSRNTPPTNSVLVTILSGAIGEATAPPAVTLLPGVNSTNFTVNGVSDGVSDGAKEVEIMVSAPGFNSGFAAITVTDLDVPDLAVAAITIPESALTDGLISVSWVITNSGLATASAPWVDEIYLSTDSQGANSFFVTAVTNTFSVPDGDSYAQSRSFLLPSDPDDYWVLIRTDARRAVTEGSERNNGGIVGPIQVQPSYRATVSTDTEVAVSGTPIPLRGRIFFSSDNSPAPSRLATVRINANNIRRTLQVLSDGSGNFETTFYPLAAEAGVYSISADHPRVRVDTTQDQFTLLGMRAVPWELNLRLAPSNILTGDIEIENLTPLPLSGLILTNIGLPAGFAAQAEFTNVISGAEKIVFRYSIGTTFTTAVRGTFIMRLQSAEGAILNIPVNFVVAPPAAELVVEPSILQRGMLRGAQSLISFDVINNGGAPSGNLNVALPVLPWLSLVSTSTIPSLEPGARTTVVLALNPASDLPLTRYDGNLAIVGNQVSATVPFQFRALSEARGDLFLRFTDEHTYFVEGAPPVTNGTVTLADPISGSIIAEGATDTNGHIRLPNLIEGDYRLEARAPNHSAVRGGIRVVPGTEIAQEIFLSQQSVTYEWTVVPTQIEDHYRVTLQPLFETEVPQPSLVVENPVILPLVIPGRVSQFEIRLRNTGLISLFRVRIPVPRHPRLLIKPLVDELAELPAQSSVSIPVTIQVIPEAVPIVARGGLHALDEGGGGGGGGGSCNGTECVIHIPIDTRYRCGTNWVPKSAEVRLEVVCVPDTGCEFERLDVTHADFFNANLLADRAEWDCLMGKLDECQKARIRGYLRSGDFGSVDGPFGFGLSDFCACGPPEKIPVLYEAAAAYLGALGFPIGGGGVSSVPFHFIAATIPGPCNAPPPGLRAASAPSEGVCARVRLEISQDVTMTRNAFVGRLVLENAADNFELSGIQLTLDFRDASNNSASERFAIRGPTLSGLVAVDGTGRLPGGATGSAEYIFLPTLEAAPDAPAAYYIGGTLRYLENGREVVIPLLPAAITVLPDAQLELEYFQQRDVFADDPFTPEIEPSEPFALALRVKNVGAGVAHNFRISSSEPKIIENEKGLLIDFDLLRVTAQGESHPSSFQVGLGDIEPRQARIVVWDMISSLQGKFIDYRASFEHRDALGDKNISLIRSVTLREMIHLVRADRAGDDALGDFLVNDQPDPQNLPDTLYLSEGTNAPVSIGVNPSLDAPVSTNDLEMVLTATMPAGWTYLRLPNPGSDFRLVRVVRSDGKVLRLGENAWVTDRSFPSSQAGAVREKLLHIFDFDSTGTYNVLFGAGDPDTNAPSSVVTALSGTSPVDFAVEWSGEDGTNGTGIAYFDVFVSVNNGLFTKWLSQTSLRSAVYQGTAGSQYAFYSVATDAAGNEESAPAVADASTSATTLVNSAPVIDSIPEAVIDEGQIFLFTAQAADTDTPAQTLRFNLAESPLGSTMDSASGLIRWETSEAQGGITNRFTIVVSDNGTPSLSSTQSFNLVVREVNSVPVLTEVALTFREGIPGNFLIPAQDSDLPPQHLGWTLNPGAPAGLILDANSGFLSWTPGEAVGPGAFSVSVTVSDDGIPARSVTRNINVLVEEVNLPPVLAPIAAQATLVETPVILTNSASDPDLPAQSFFFSLAPGAPRGAKVHPQSGIFTWTPGRDYGLTTNRIIVRVTDDGVPSITSTQLLTVVVGDFSEVLLGQGTVLAGETGSVPIRVRTTTPLANVSFVFQAPDMSRLGDFTLSPSVSPITSSILQDLGNNRFEVRLQASAGQPIANDSVVSELRFSTANNQPSAFVPLAVPSVSAMQANGQPAPRALGSDGRVAYLSAQPLLEIASGANQQADLAIFARISASYVIQTTPSLVAPIVWTNLRTNVPSSLQETISITSTNRAQFLRVFVP